MAADLDAEYATAVLDVLARGDEPARRVSRALEWVALGTSNTTALGADGRVLAWRAGFEVLLAGGATPAETATRCPDCSTLRRNRVSRDDRLARRRSSA